MTRKILHRLRLILSARRLNAHLAVENLALRQQIGMYARRETQPRFTQRDRLFWMILYRLWPGWRTVLLNAKPATVIKWHRAGFRQFWRWKSRPKKPGRPRLSPEIQELIRLMAEANPGWGAPRIHGELLLLGFEVHERNLKSILTEYFAYYHDDRTHYNLGKETPSGRLVQPKPSEDAEVVALPRLGGLHHRYEWRVAA
jgi:hypothetical protein